MMSRAAASTFTLLLATVLHSCVEAQQIAEPPLAPIIVTPVNGSLPLPSEAACAFVETSPRYYKVEADLTLFGGGQNYPASDALIRALRSELSLADCQLSITQGETCDSGTATLPCPDPFYQCPGGITLSPMLYDTVKNNECSLPSGATQDTLICRALAADTTITNAVTSGNCTAACFLTLTRSATSSELPQNCISSAVAIKVPSQEEANRIASALSNSTSITRITSLMEQFRNSTSNGGSGTGTGGDGTGSASGNGGGNNGNGGNIFANTNSENNNGNINDGNNGGSSSPSSSESNSSSGSGSNAFAPGAAPTATPVQNETLSLNVVHAQIKPVVGFGYFPPPPSPPPPPPPLAAFEQPPLYTSLSGEPTTVNGSTLLISDWSECYPHCGSGFTTRSSVCTTSYGAVISSSLCTETKDTSLYKQCQSPCDKPHYSYTPWSQCSTTCDGGTATRTAQCLPPTDPSSCGAVGDLEVTCNTNPCEVSVWEVSSYGECSAPCGGGVRSRSVRCLDAAGQQVDDAQCATEKPAVEEPCNTQPCDFCSNNLCLGRGTCLADICECGKGYEGKNCETPKSCDTGVVDSMLQCCDSGLIDSQGRCCPKNASLDKSGQCCAQAVDACGMCGGTSRFMDLQGVCCEVVDANGLCCASGRLDECGVCDGIGNSCSTNIVMKMLVDSSLIVGEAVVTAPMNELLTTISSNLGLSPNYTSVDSIWMASAEEKEGRKLRRLQFHRHLAQSTTPTAAPVPVAEPAVEPVISTGTALPVYMNMLVLPVPNTTATTTSTPPASAPYLEASMKQQVGQRASNGQAELTEVLSSGRAGVCGNKVCEVGERSIPGITSGTCPQDCRAPLKPCGDAGCGARGICMPASGVCDCFKGHTGDYCQECAYGYVRSSVGACVSSVVDLKLVDPSVMDASGIALVDTAEDEGLSGGAIAGIVLASLIGAVLLVFPVVWLCKRQRFGSKRRRFDAEDHTGYFEGVQEISLREKYNAGVRTSGGNPNSSTLHGSSANQAARQFHIHVNAGRVVGSNTDLAPLNRAHGEGGTGGRGPMGQNAHRLSLSQSQVAAGKQAMLMLPHDGEMSDADIDAWIRQGGHYPLERPNDGGGRDEDAPGPSNAAHNDNNYHQGLHPSLSHSLRDSHPMLAGPYPAVSPEAPVDASQIAVAGSSQHGVHPELQPVNRDAPAPLVTESQEVDYRKLLTSYTTTNLDPEARLYFNPAYSMEGKAAQLSASVAGEYQDIPRPAPIALPLSARNATSTGDNKNGVERNGSQTARAAIAVGGPVAATAAERRAKLEALRNAVNALEEETGKRGLKKKEKNSLSNGSENVDTSKKKESTFSVVAHALQKFSPKKGTRTGPLQSRPAVPRLQLNPMRPSYRPTRQATTNTNTNNRQPPSKDKGVPSIAAAVTSEDSGSVPQHPIPVPGALPAVRIAATNSGEASGSMEGGLIKAVHGDEEHSSPLRKLPETETTTTSGRLSARLNKTPLSARGGKEQQQQGENGNERASVLPKADPRYSMVMSLVNGALRGVGGGADTPENGHTATNNNTHININNKSNVPVLQETTLPSVQKAGEKVSAATLAPVAQESAPVGLSPWKRGMAWLSPRKLPGLRRA